jgi:hypothetical protein
MRKIPFTTTVLLMFALCGVSLSGIAQDAGEFGADQFSRAIRSQDLDSFWLDQNMWMQYGYRPRFNTQLTPFTNLPSYSAGQNDYSYGTTLPAPSVANPLDKKSIQLTKYGTWH